MALAARPVASQPVFLQSAVLADLAVPAVVLAGDLPVLELDAMFRQQPLLRCVVVLGDRGPAVLDRSWFQFWITGPLGYGRAVHERSRLRDLNPPASLVLAADVDIDIAAAAVIETQRRAMIDNVGVLWPDGRIATTTTTAVFEMLSRLYAFQALHDALTGLPNRAHLMERLRQAGRSPDDLALLYVDLDRFKDVNDSFGHAAGDQVLTLFAERLRRLAAPDDLVVRLSGDEFAVLLSGPQSVAQGQALAEQVVLEAAAPFVVELERGGGDHDRVLICVGASVGLAGSRPGERRRFSSLESLLKHADLAMYHAKTLGRGRVSQFDRELLLDRGAMQRKQARHYIERRLRTAIHDGGLELHYQPLVDLASGRIIGAEALARWRDGELGDVPPDEFISVAEESGLIVDLGSWALETACRQAVTWPGSDDAPGVAVNVSAVQIAQPSFIGEVIAVLQVSGLPPARLCLEITETAAIGELEQTAQRLRQLRDLGVRIALDDFGTGFSSLTMLRRLPVNIVKIDKSFIDRITLGANDAVLVRLLIDAAHSFGLTVCAEGVEQLQQAEQLSMMGCDLVQGWLIAKALPGSAAFAAWSPTLISRP